MAGTASATTVDRPAVRIARALASPRGVLVTIPLLVIAVGGAILLLGRDATRTSAKALARSELTTQAQQVASDVAFALDQAASMLERLRTLADRARPADEVLVRVADLMTGRPGVAYASISFSDGTFRGAYLGDGGRVEVQESRIGAGGTAVSRFTVEGGALVPLRTETTDYDPRKRTFYRVAEQTGSRAWTAPYTFFETHETGITCTEPVYGAEHRLAAVLTVDFEVAALSKYVARPAVDHARSIVFTGDGTILAAPAEQLAKPAGDALLRHDALRDDAFEALYAQPRAPQLHFVDFDSADGAYFAAISPIGGVRAGVAAPLDWYVATLVPARTLLGPTRALERSSALASLAALAIAVGLALVLAWNLVRMRRQVTASRAAQRTAEARARELGSYRLVARLGAGGMGEVWRAEHRLLARTAAIKLIRPEALRDPAGGDEIRERFRREAQTLASMRSHHTIAIYDYGVTDEGTFYYVMELLDGLDLESLVVRYGPQPAARVIGLLADACASLAEAHDAGLLHRDIKPPNLFVCREADEVDIGKLLDFGIVQATSEPEPLASPTTAVVSASKLTQLGAMLGTPGFMPPEQILGMPLDGRADLYALGCCAWWLLTGREVFAREDNEAKLLHEHIYEPVADLQPLVPGWCPPQLAALVQQCLAKDANDRPADARALAAALRAIPIPDACAWSAAHAGAWWRAYQPAVPPAPVSASEVQVIMPGAIDARPATATSESAMAQTIATGAR